MTLAAACLLVALQLSSSRDALPPLPRVAPETFPADARAALTPAVEAARRRPADPAAVGELAMTLHAWDQWELAHVAYTRLARLAPQAPEWPYLDGVALQRLARPAEAADRFIAALRLAPSLVAVRARLGDALFDAGRIPESAEAFQPLAADPSAAPVGAYGLGRAAAARGDHRGAIAQFERAIALFPDFGPAHYALAMSLRAIGRREDAAAELSRHAALGARWPALPDPYTARVQALRDDPRGLMQKGMRLVASGDLGGATAAYEAALDVNPRLATAHANLITLYGRVHEPAKAEAHYTAVLALGADLEEAHYNFGVVLGEQRRWTEAAAAYRRALGVNPLHAGARNNLGQILELERRLAEAEDEYRRAVDAQPGFRLARFNLARVRMARRDFRGAIAEFEKLRTPVDAETPRYVYGLAVALVQAGERGRGLPVAEEARRLAERFGQRDLVAAIDRDLASLQ